MTARKEHPRRLLSAVLPVLLLAACAASDPTVTPLPAEPVDVAGQEWDLIFISASNGWGVADHYAAMIEEDLGVTVTVHDLALGSLRAGEVIEGFSGGSLRFEIKQLPELLPEAEVVVIGTLDPSDSLPDGSLGDWECMGDLLPLPNYVNDCSPEVWEPYLEDMRAIYEGIFSFRAGQPTIVRVLELYARPAWWIRDGVLEECGACWGAFLGSINEVAAGFNIPAAHVYDDWTAPDHTGDPADRGYIGNDGIHPSDAGSRAQAELLRALGYAYTWP